jgi:hypothetical protein
VYRTGRLRVFSAVHCCAVSGVMNMTSGLHAGGALPFGLATACGSGGRNGVMRGDVLTVGSPLVD